MTHQKLFPIIDGHNDTLLNLLEPERGQGRSFFEESETGHIDLPRARKGGFAGGFFAMFTPNPPVKEGHSGKQKDKVASFLDSAMSQVTHEYALSKTLAMTRLMYDLEMQSEGAVRVVKDLATFQWCLKNNVMVMIPHIEGAEAIDGNLDALYVLYQAGLRSLGIVWSRPNIFGYGVPFDFPGSPDAGPGLTPAGIELVRACNELGIMIDVSHLNEKGFWDVVKHSTHPVVATHSGVHAICASPRNLTDKQMDAIKDSGGIMGINFHVGFLRADGQRDENTPLSQLVRHIDYTVERIGIEHVALGSDFDGATMPRELGDVAGLPRLTDLLLDAGYVADDIQKIGTGNWERILGATWK